MCERLSRFIILIFICGLTGNTIGEEFRRQVSLDGQWQFQLDPKGIGQKNHWFGSDDPFSGNIQVPGAWDAQGYGHETEKLKHNYIGKAWYKKEVVIPDSWQNQKIFICFGGVYRYAKVWINNQYLGEHIGYTSDFEFEITPYITFAKTTIITIEIDSEQRWDIDTLHGCTDIIDHMQTYWGGIWGHISLEARAKTWLTDIF